MKDIPIKKFGQKLMASAKSINNIPDEYMSYSQNARIYDGGIGVRKGSTKLTNSILGTVNQGAFLLGDNLYQVANSNIYQINKSTGAQTLIDNLGYDARIDIVTTYFPKGDFVSLGQEDNSYSGLGTAISKIRYNATFNIFELLDAGDTVIETLPITIDNSGFDYPAVSLRIATTSSGQASGTGETAPGGFYYILEDGEYMLLTSSRTTGVINDYEVGYYGAVNYALIASDGEQVQLFNGTALSSFSSQPVNNSGIIENINGYNFLAYGSVLYTSVPITRPQDFYNFTGSGSQTLSFDEQITGLKATLTGLYIFLETQVHYLGSNSLQNIASSATFITTPLGANSGPINNLLITASGEKIFWLSRNLQIQTINYEYGVTTAQIGDLSAKPIVSFTEYLQTIDTSQPYGYAFYNEQDKLIQFYIRSDGATENDVCIVYDLVNETWNVDIGKDYNYMVKDGYTYYGFSDTDTSIYVDNVGKNDNGNNIDFQVKTNNITVGQDQALFGGFYIKGGADENTTLDIGVTIEDDSVFTDTIIGTTTSIAPFDKRADQGRIWRMGKRIQYTIGCNVASPNFILDRLGTTAEPTSFSDINNKF